MEEQKNRRRSLFFPLALIATGVIWILVSMGKIPSQNVWALTHLWPFLLIAAGLGLILRSFWAGSRLLVDVLIVGGAVAAIVFAPQLGWNTPQWGLPGGFGFDGGVAGSGKVITSTREAHSFSAISIAYPADVLIQQGKVESVKFEAEDNLIPQLSSDVRDGTLYINNKVSGWGERVRPTKPVRITIVVKDLRAFDFSSAGTVKIEKLETEALSVDLSGAGELTITELKVKKLNCELSGVGSFSASGSADALSLDMSGVGSFNGIDLATLTANVQLSGLGSARVHVKDDLTAQVSGAGSVLYYGSPSVHKQISGLGSINQAKEK